MKIDLRYVTWKTVAIYAAFGWALQYLMPESPTAEQWAAFAGALGAMLLIDVYSFNQGLRRGGEIADEILKEVCKAKKIRVVRNES